MTAAQTSRELRELAGLCGIQLAYTAGDGRRVAARADSLVAILNALGHPVEDAGDVTATLEHLRAASQERTVEPVMVVGADGTASAPVVIDSSVDPVGLTVTVVTESGEVRVESLAALGQSTGVVGEQRRTAYQLTFGRNWLLPGYHRMRIDGAGVDASALVLVPPAAPTGRRRDFGVIAPLYAIRSAADWGIGSYTDLGDFAAWVGRSGGALAGTLPLLSGCLREPVDPSPYLPYSRLFWNEIFVDPTSLPESGQPAVSSLLESAGFQRALEKQAAEPEVDYAAVMDAKREVFTLCAAELLGSNGSRRDDYERYVVAHPELTRYAEFRAADDLATSRWRSWPASPGRLPAAAIDPTAVDYHRYVQFAAVAQLSKAATAGAGLYLDLPVGVHPDGYDTWAYSEIFATAGVGAPPDPMAPAGQSWGFPPLHPERLRETGYDYLIRTYRELFRYADAARIDHVLGLHRMFWIPSGLDARDGAYVRYHHEELRAIIAIEAARAGTLVIGEDLGTVTPAIRQAMDRDGMLHSFVTKFDASPDQPLPQPRRPSAASVGSHDLPKFAASWAEQPGLGAHDPRSGMDSDQALEASLFSLAAGPSDVVFADLGDLLGETVPDNRPGTGPEAGNWRHRLPKPLEQIEADPAVTNVLTGIRDRREGDSR